VKIRENLGKNGAQRDLIWKKWRPTFAESREHFFRRSSQKKSACEDVYTKSFFRASFGIFGRNSFAPPNICLLLHQGLQTFCPRATQAVKQQFEDRTSCVMW